MLYAARCMCAVFVHTKHIHRVQPRVAKPRCQQYSDEQSEYLDAVCIVQSDCHCSVSKFYIP